MFKFTWLKSIGAMLLVAGIIPLCWAQSGGADNNRTLWRIGQADNSTAEFAHAPKDYAKYSEPGLFVVGDSNAKKDWPYVQPGTIDGGWAPGTSQTFEIYFGLETVPKSGSCRLVLDFVDTHSVDPPKLKVDINGTVSTHQTPKGTGDASVFGEPSKGREHVMTVSVPTSKLKKGNNRIAITTVSGSWLLWDAVTFHAPQGAKLMDVSNKTFMRATTGPSVLLRHEDQTIQPITLNVRHIGKPILATLRVGKLKAIAVSLKPGTQSIKAYALPVDSPKKISATLRAGQQTLAQTDVDLKPIRKWELHLVHQTHLDIGYTHTQEEVLKLQVDWLHRAMQYIEKSKAYPKESQFKWHPEGMWAVDELMRTAGDDEKKQFVEACRRGQIHLDVLYAQAMTGMYNEEELMELMGAAKRFEKQYGVPVTSAMQSDVPGYTWGLATALAHCNVPHMSVGPNGGHRVGHTFEWGDKPFWWVSPSGKHKILFWMCGGGYYGFQEVNKRSIFSAINRLESKSYPYRHAMVRVLSGKDNAPPNPNLSDAVLAWNKKYVSPKLVLSTNSGFLKLFAEMYKDKLPIIKGDFTPYWEDGSASTSKATSVNRQACEKIAQVQILWAMLNPDLKLHERFDVAWNKMIMYDEHTWGAHNSTSRPDHPFAIQQDKYKQAYAFDGSSLTDALLKDVTKAVHQSNSAVIDVYNTVSWQRDDLVLIPKGQSTTGDRIKDDQGSVVPSQRLASGELAFVAKKIPAFGARRYTIHAGKAHQIGSAKASGLKLTNGLLSLEIDSQSGAIKSLKHKAIGKDLVDRQKATGLNDYLYIIGRDANKNRSTIQGSAKVTVEDGGPIVATLRIETDAPGCEKLIRRVRLVEGFDHVELINTTDKLKERKPEGVYFGFPFNIPGAISRIDVPWAVVQVEKDQMRGANRNFYCVQRWVDLSNEDYGVTWVTVDAPMLQFDPIKIAGAGGTHWWRTQIDPGSYIHSWVMNNHWETNFKADQEGLITFRYALAPHVGGYDPVSAQRVARNIHQPLLAVFVDHETPVIKPLLQALPGGIIVTSIRPSRDGKATMIRMFNTADKSQNVRLKWNRKIGKTWISNPMEDKVSNAPRSIEMVRFEVVTLRVEQP